MKTSPSGPITTGSTVIPITTTDSAGVTTIIESTAPLCYGGNCNANQHTPGGSVTTTHMPTYSQALETPLVVSGCNWLGCYDDDGGNKALNPRVLPDSRDTMTIELCVGECLRLGYIFAGLEYGSECYCGPEISPLHAPAYGNTSTEDIIITCSNPEFSCRGNRAQMCGGFAAIGIYSCPANNPTTTTVSFDCFEGVEQTFLLVAIVFRLATATVHLERFVLAELYTNISVDCHNNYNDFDVSSELLEPCMVTTY